MNYYGAAGLVKILSNSGAIFTPELVFTELILQTLYWICAIAIHSRVFVLDLPTNIDL
jgi:hypothetical protein